MNKSFSENPNSTGLQDFEDFYENIYANEIPETRKTKNTETTLPSASDPGPAGPRCYRLAVVVLLMLVVLSLVAIAILWSNFKNLTTERDHLETSCKELASLNASYRSVFEERDQFQQNIAELQKKYSQLKEDIDIPGWNYFTSSIYFISTEKKSWSESRSDCQSRGADLVIINNKEEQDMVNMWRRNEIVWIGANDQDIEGTWKWVDGTPLTYNFWRSGEPNDENEEDCAVSGYKSESGWNDVPCSSKNIWICETRINT